MVYYFWEKRKPFSSLKKEGFFMKKKALSLLLALAFCLARELGTTVDELFRPA